MNLDNFLATELVGMKVTYECLNSFEDGNDWDDCGTEAPTNTEPCRSCGATRWSKGGLRGPDTGYSPQSFAPSTNPEHCLMAMEEMRKNNEWDIEILYRYVKPRGWVCTYYSALNDDEVVGEHTSFTVAVTKAIAAALGRTEE